MIIMQANLVFICTPSILEIIMNHEQQKNYFEIAYRTGSDVWTHIPYQVKALEMLPVLEQNSLVLDIGSGRGIWAMKLANMGYRVLGIDYIGSIVENVNAEIVLNKLESKVRFVQGDVRDIPFTETSFNLVTDIGVLQHLEPADWPIYMRELNRVVMDNGYVLSVTLSKETVRFMGFSPKQSGDGNFEKFGVSYYFFSNDEIASLFSYGNFTLVNQTIEFYDARTDPGDRIALVFSLFQKK